MLCELVIVCIILCDHHALVVLKNNRRWSIQTPIVLVHGFGGWGRKFSASYIYWGRRYGDYAQKLREDGFRISLRKLARSLAIGTERVTYLQ